MLTRAINNAFLGDGCFWKHPESKHHNIVWTSVDQDWLQWKTENLVPKSLRLPVHVVRRAGHSSCFANAKTLYGLKTKVSPLATEAYSTLSVEDVLARIDLLDVAIWYLDDGCCFPRKDCPTGKGFRVVLSVGSLTQEVIQPVAERLFGTSEIGRVVKNNSRATENNKSWVIPKTIAIQIMREARKIAPPSMIRKVPLW